jgi:hypothetical protein
MDCKKKISTYSFVLSLKHTDIIRLEASQLISPRFGSYCPSHSACQSDRLIRRVILNSIHLHVSIAQILWNAHVWILCFHNLKFFIHLWCTWACRSTIGLSHRMWITFSNSLFCEDAYHRCCGVKVGAFIHPKWEIPLLYSQGLLYSLCE